MNSMQTQDSSPLRNRSYSPVISPQKNPIHMQTYVKPVSQFPNNSYVQVTPPRATNVVLATPSTAQTLYSINGSAPSRFNVALDQVCMLGHEMDTMRKNFELVQVELQQWKDKCSLIKAIASTPPPGTNYSPTRVSKLRNDVQSQFTNYQGEINKLNSIISNVNSEIMISAEKIKALERRVGEMNKIELEMLSAKKQALELNNRNRFQALELNDLKSKIDTKNYQNDELVRQILIIPQLKESVNILEEENKKLISIIQQKDDQQNRSDQKHMQLTKMYQENLEKSNEIVNQLRDMQSENEELSGEIEKLNNMADSVSSSNIRNSAYLQKLKGRQSGEMSFNGEDLKNSAALKRSGLTSSQNRGQKSNKLSQIQSTMIDQQSLIEQLQSSVRDKDQSLAILSKEKENLLGQIQDQIGDIQQLRNDHQQQREDHDEKTKKAKRDFSEQFVNAVTPLQKENEQMHSEIERIQLELQQAQLAIQELEHEKQQLENQLNIERQQAYNTQQKIIKDSEIKSEALTERILKKEGELNNELIKNKELFEDNKLMAEEMRILKQKSSELEHWKNKYRELKKETKLLRQQFDEYKQSFIREIQNRFSDNCGQFEQCLQQIDERFDSTRNHISSYANNNSNTNEIENHLQYFQSPHRSIRESDAQIRSSSPTQEKLKAMKQTPSRSSTVANKMQTNNGSSSMNYNPLNNQSNVSPPLNERQQPSALNSNISTFSNNNASGHSRNPSDKYDILNSQAFKYQNEILQTNQELDFKLEELVILKAKYEEALNRVHSNITTTPKK